MKNKIIENIGKLVLIDTSGSLRACRLVKVDSTQTCVGLSSRWSSNKESCEDVDLDWQYIKDVQIISVLDDTKTEDEN
jgi:hypothetical protein